MRFSLDFGHVLNDGKKENLALAEILQLFDVMTVSKGLKGVFSKSRVIYFIAARPDRI